MKKLLLAFALLLAPTAASAQCTGVFQPNTLCGNLGVTAAPPSQFTSSGTVVGPGSSTIDDIATFANTFGTQIKDSGVPIALYGTGGIICNVKQVSPAAKGDGTTDDTASFNACKTIVQAFPNSGTIYVPPSTGASYCIKTGPLVLNGLTSLIGAGGGQILSACGSGLGVLVMGGTSGNEGYTVVQNIELCGAGCDGTTGYGITTDPLTVAQNCIRCLLLNVQTYGGRHAITWSSGEATAIHLSAAQAYGGSNIYFVGSSGHTTGGWLYDVFPDSNQYPQGTIPGAGTVFGNRATTHTYTAGTVVLATCQDSNTYYLQAMVGGTSSGSATLSNCANYSTNFTDGTVTWQLNFPANFYHWQFDSYTSEVKVYRCDMGGGYAGAAMTNTVGGGAAPNLIFLNDCNSGFSYLTNFYGHDGSSVMLHNFNTSSCITTGCSNIIFQNNFLGDVTISGGYNNSGATGVSINVGSKYVITGVADWTGDTTAIALGTGSVPDLVDIHDNPVGAVPITYSGNTGAANNIHDNQGFNNKGTATIVTLGASPATYTNGPQPQTAYITGGTVSSVKTVGGVNLCLASPCQLQFGPNESVVVTYSSLPAFNTITH